MENQDKKTLEEIKEIIESFDKDFDDPIEALQDIARIMKIDKQISDFIDDDEDEDDEDWEDENFDEESEDED